MSDRERPMNAEADRERARLLCQGPLEVIADQLDSDTLGIVLIALL